MTKEIGIISTDSEYNSPNLCTTSQTTTSTSSRSRGRPRSFEGELIRKFSRKGNLRIRGEVIWNCVIRRFLRKLYKRLAEKDYQDAKLKHLGLNLSEMDWKIDANHPQISSTLGQWQNNLGRSSSLKNRQYNRPEIEMLLQSSILKELFKDFVLGLLTCESSRKSSIFRFSYWPDEGDKFIKEIFKVDSS